MKKKTAAFHKQAFKKVIWDNKAKKYIRSLDQETKREIGTLLMMLQTGQHLGEPQSKPFRSLHSKAFELRIKDKKGAHRIFYVMITENQILIPHAFLKKTQKTPLKEIATATTRLNALLEGNNK